MVQGREAIAPIPMKIAAAHGERRDVTLLVIPASNDQLVHCLLDASHEARLRGFIDRVARRARRGSRAGSRRNDILTTREREVLTLLAQDQSQQEIAERLGVSYTTVRNHVQHILSKLGVHSILEAVAVSLIDEG
jgi:DNA-binding NarL/FixJ family response regulator